MPPAERFWAAVDRSGGPEACWPWLLSLRDTGYGQVYWGGRSGVKAHRVAFFLGHGYWPKNVLHHCDNAVCCNPAHLYAGSLKRNTQDAIRRRRMLVGELNGNAKLTAADVRTILATKEPYVVLAQRYGVRVWTISRIKRRITWTHVTRPPVP